MQTMVYFIQVNICLALFYLFYWFMLRKETFHQSNRAYLMGCVLASFIIPVTQLASFKNLFIARKVAQVQEYFVLQNINLVEADTNIFSWQEGLVILYELGVSVFFAVFCLKVWKLIQLFRRKEQHEAFSFFNTVHVQKELDQSSIIAYHEFVHSKEWHSVDIMLFEFLKIFFWFNPVVWMYQSSLRKLHEYIADEQSAYYQGNISEYAMLILNRTLGVSNVALSNQFFNSSMLKERIVMLHRSKSPARAKLKLGVALPLFAVLLVFSSSKIDANTPIEKIVDEVSLEKPISMLKDNAVAMVSKTKVLPIVKTQTKKDTSFYDYDEVDEPANFPGGMQEFGKFLANNLKSPAEAVKNNVSGKVLIGFVVEKDGSLGRFKVLKSVGYGCDEEAIRVLKLSPKWKPAVYKDKKVALRFQIPINFVSNQKTKDSVGMKESISNQSVIHGGKKVNAHSSIAAKNLLYILDGKEVDYSEVEALERNNAIISVDVLKHNSAVEKYGEKGKNGVVIVTSK